MPFCRVVLENHSLRESHAMERYSSDKQTPEDHLCGGTAVLYCTVLDINNYTGHIEGHYYTGLWLNLLVTFDYFLKFHKSWHCEESTGLEALST